MTGHYTLQIALTSVNRDEEEEEWLKYKRTRKGHSLVNWGESADGQQAFVKWVQVTQI